MLERTKAMAVAEVRFGTEFGSLNERFWQHIDTTLNVVQAVAGMLALGGAIAQGSLMAGLAAAVVAIVSGLQLTLRPLQRSIDFRDARRRFQDLDKVAWKLSLDELDERLADLRKDAPQGLESLARPALIAVERREGVSPHDVLTWRERFAAALA